MRTPLLILFLLLWVVHSSGQSPIAKNIAALKAQLDNTASYTLFHTISQEDSRVSELPAIATGARFLKINHTTTQVLLIEAPRVLSLDVPMSEGRTMRLEMYRARLTTPDFVIRTSSGFTLTEHLNDGLHYRGIIQGQPGSVVAMSIFEDEVMGLLTTKDGNLIIGKLHEGEAALHVLYNDRDMIDPPEFYCATSDEGPGYTLDELKSGTGSRDPGDCVRIFVEVDYPVLEIKGEVPNTANYILGLFNESFALYAADGVTMVMSELMIWDIPSPYTGTTTSEMLASYQANTDAFNGDLAHFLSNAVNGGVAASIGGLCNPEPDYSKCYSTLPITYRVYPAFSFAVQLISHEMGHLLGSRHTHACVWNGDNTRIDGCHDNEGTCDVPPLPPEGGTIMSYCFADSVGIDLSLGFGPQPGNVIRNKVEEADNCLMPCEVPALMDDAGVVLSLPVLSSFCDTSFDAVVTFKNYGSNNLNSVVIHYQVDSLAPDSMTWSGALLAGETTDVAVAIDGCEYDIHTFAAWTTNPNGTEDSEPSNDLDVRPFCNGPNELVLTINQDAFQFETYWLIKNAEGEILTGGTIYDTFYHDYSTAIDYMCVPDGCYEFIMFDSRSNGICCENGEGSYELVEGTTGMTFATGGEYGFSESTYFCTPSNVQACELLQTFPVATLTHSGPGNSSTAVPFINAMFSSFTISDIDQKTNGNPVSKYIDVVQVLYVNVPGDTLEYGTYSGADVNEVPVLIPDSVTQIVVTLENGFEGSSADVSVDLSNVTFCGNGIWPSQAVYVDPDATGSETGYDWPNALLSLEDAVDVAPYYRCDTCSVPPVPIWMADGEYTPETLDRSFSHHLNSDIQILGSFAGIEVHPNERAFVTPTTVISGDIGIPGDIGDNLYHVFTIGPSAGSAVLDGVQICCGNADGIGYDAVGAGILGEGGIMLRNVALESCSSSGQGAAIYYVPQSGDTLRIGESLWIRE